MGEYEKAMKEYTKEPWRVELQSESLDRYIVSDAEDRIVLQLLPRNLAEKIVNDHNEIAQLRADRAELLEFLKSLYRIYETHEEAIGVVKHGYDLIKRMEAGE
jgi:hypothetical protein